MKVMRSKNGGEGPATIETRAAYQSRTVSGSRRRPALGLLLLAAGACCDRGPADLLHASPVARLMHNDAFKGGELTQPWRLIDYAARAGMAGLPAAADARRAEVDGLGVILVVEPRGEQPHDMHARKTPVGSQFAHRCAVAFRLGDVLEQFVDDMPQPVRLLLADDVACNPARVLDVRVAMHHFPHRLRLRTVRVPYMDGKDQRAAPGTL